MSTAAVPPFDRITGPMAQRFREFDWAATPLGPLESWSRSLRSAAAMALECQLPMYIAWGPQFIQIYNDAYRPILGFKDADALGNQAPLTWHEIWPTIGPMFARAKGGEPIGFNDYKLTIERFGHPEDCYFNFSYSALYDDEGVAQGVLVTFAETTEQVQAERRLKLLDRIAQGTRTMSNPAEVMSFTAEMLGKHLGANRCAYAHVLEDEDTFDVFGDYNDDVKSIVGRYRFTDFGERVHRLMVTNRSYVNPDVDHDPQTAGSDLSAYRLTQIQAVICVPLHKDGRFVAAMAVHQNVPRRWSQEDVELVQTIVDRCWDSLERLRSQNERERLLESERAARGAAERANVVKDDFLATLSHELRTPMSSITGWVHILKMKLPATQPELMKGVEVIERSTRAQLKLIDELLDMSRITSGKLQIESRAVAPTELVQAAVDMLRPKAESGQLQLDCKLDKVPPITGDPVRLQQVVSNLLSNAIKFTPPGGRIAVELMDDGSDLLLRVFDTGIGIPPDFLPHVFERFRQADGSITRRHGGLGLGLSIVKHIVEAHAGTVTAESRGNGQGASITVRLPRLAAPESRPSAAPHGKALTPVAATLQGKHVVIVKDDRDSCELIERLFVENGARVSAHADATSAEHALLQDGADVLISDLGLPGIDGLTFIRRLRRHADLKRLPAVAVTAFARPEDEKRALEAGFDHHFTKPIRPEALLGAVADLVDQLRP